MFKRGKLGTLFLSPIRLATPHFLTKFFVGSFYLHGGSKGENAHHLGWRWGRRHDAG